MTKGNTAATSQVDMELEALGIQQEDLAVDLHATAPPEIPGRIYWEDDRYVQLGLGSVDCSIFMSRLSNKDKDSFKKHIITHGEDQTLSSSSLLQLVQAFGYSGKDSPPKKFDVIWASNSLHNNNFRHNKYKIQKFLEYWSDRYPGAVSNDALNFLAQAAPFKNISNNVESDDPTKSWLSDEEYADLLRAIWDFYDGTDAHQPTLIRLLSMHYARRPTQLRSLKFCDLKTGAEKILSKIPDPEIHFPSAKEQDADVDFRGGKFEIHPVADHLWSMLMIQRKHIKVLFFETMGVELSESQLEQVPIFTTALRIKTACTSLKEKLGLEPALHTDDSLFHLPANLIGKVLNYEGNGGSTNAYKRNYPAHPPLPISSRTGQPIVVTATRLRHTRVRQLARQGVKKSVVSYWLGHNDDNALKSYYHDPAEEARQLDEAMSKGLTPIAMAFHGRIICTDAESTHPNDPSKRVELAKGYQLHYVGRCGKYSFCSTTSIPIPCYMCKNFEPLVDAPHQEVLDALLYRQQQEQDLIRPGSMRNLLNPIDLSMDIMAVRRCIQLCDAKRKSMNQPQC